MTETKKKALALLNEVAKEMGLEKVSSLELDMPGERALLRALEQHEAFRREVSDAVEELAVCVYEDSSSIVRRYMGRFIIPKSDPLVEVLDEVENRAGGYCSDEERANYHGATRLRPPQGRMGKGMTDKGTHASDCDWQVDQYPWECTCGLIARKKAMDELIAQDADLINIPANQDRLSQITLKVDNELGDQIIAAWLANHIQWTREAYESATGEQDKTDAMLDLYAMTRIYRYATGAAQ